MQEHQKVNLYAYICQGFCFYCENSYELIFNLRAAAALLQNFGWMYHLMVCYQYIYSEYLNCEYLSLVFKHLLKIVKEVGAINKVLGNSDDKALCLTFLRNFS